MEGAAIITVTQAHCDELGHLNHVEAVRYLERARGEWYRQCGLYDGAGAQSLGTVVVNSAPSRITPTCAGWARFEAPFTELVDWWQKDDLQRQMRSKIKRQLCASGIEADAVESLATDIVDLAKVRTDR